MVKHLPSIASAILSIVAVALFVAAITTHDNYHHGDGYIGMYKVCREYNPSYYENDSHSLKSNTLEIHALDMDNFYCGKFDNDCNGANWITEHNGQFSCNKYNAIRGLTIAAAVLGFIAIIMMLHYGCSRLPFWYTKYACWIVTFTVLSFICGMISMILLILQRPRGYDYGYSFAFVVAAWALQLISAIVFASRYKRGHGHNHIRNNETVVVVNPNVQPVYTTHNHAVNTRI